MIVRIPKSQGKIFANLESVIAVLEVTPWVTRNTVLVYMHVYLPIESNSVQTEQPFLTQCMLRNITTRRSKRKCLNGYHCTCLAPPDISFEISASISLVI